MMRRMLARMEDNPHAVFYEKELRQLFPEEFERARSEGLVQRVASFQDAGYHGFGLPRPYRVVRLEDGTFEAFDDEDPEVDTIILSPADLAQWRLNLEVITEGFRQTNQLRGHYSAIDDRLHFLGEAERDSLSIGFVLALCHSGPRTPNTLAALPNLLADNLDRFVVVCPCFSPSATERRELESLGIFVVPVGADDPFVLDYAPALRKPGRRVPRIVLSDEEEREFEAARFQGRLPIRITCKAAPPNRNITEVAGAEVVLGDAPFRLFLRLVVALFESGDGFLSRDHLRYAEGIDSELTLATEGLDQALSRLRGLFDSKLGDVNPRQFIEVRSGRVRLSTHRRYVSYDRDALLNHADEAVRALAQRLPR